jgi:hypothetical protein
MQYFSSRIFLDMQTPNSPALPLAANFKGADNGKGPHIFPLARFYNPRRRHATLGISAPVEYEEQAKLA